jgi:RHH-type proline utilization regulon transcriptional repressor/proline dehydrogenase/delta 1-pyrroline-5-carboxylate dehydrogenase
MPSHKLTSLRNAINQFYLAEEATVIDQLLSSLHKYNPVRVCAIAGKLVSSIRSRKDQQSLFDVFLHEYQLNSTEGIVLMSIAEALLRIPDSHTQDQFLQDKLSTGNWLDHAQHSHSVLLNLSINALQLAGSIEQHIQHPGKIYDGILSRLGTPLIRSAIKQAMQQMAYQFVIAEDIHKAMNQAEHHQRYRYSFDMLGEAALTEAGAERYFQAYLDAIKALAKQAIHKDLYKNPGISIKLSALYPRYEPLHHQQAEQQLGNKLLYLVRQARASGITVTIDAEESERLEMSLNIFQSVFCHSDLQDWNGFGLAVQAYQKRAFAVITWLATLAESHKRRIPIRLVKGAYWDSEIKRAQENGLSDYPVFTHKSATDLSYLACAEFILSKKQAFYPQFATHNAHTVCAIHDLADVQNIYEFQRLHGMGDLLYQQILEHENWQTPCRIYAPVGYYQDLLPYLVRRLLENGANTSFINQIENPAISIATITQDPVVGLKSKTDNKSAIVLPENLYGKERLNSAGLNLGDPHLLTNLQQDLDDLAKRQWQASPLINGKPHCGTEHPIYSPYDQTLLVGNVIHADKTAIQEALQSASDAFPDWRLCSVSTRARYLQKAAELFEKHRLELVTLCVREGGRSIKDALAEVREAVDFCRYYAAGAEKLFARPRKLPGPTGELNQLHYYGRGVFACISPWNFPIAIFTGQITAALAAGNTVLAKPAGQTPLTAMRCIQLLHQAGVPEQVLHLLPGDGVVIGETLLQDQRIAGVAFTGSSATAGYINRQLATHSVIVPLIAETGGQNVLIADSSAHNEQLVQDALSSAFNSAGQRCSALRVLFVQQEIADKITKLLIGAMYQLVIGNPHAYASDVGPVINQSAVDQLTQHVESMHRKAKVLYQMAVPKQSAKGSFFPPTLIELSSLSQLEKEIFGPVLHIIRYRSSELTQVIEAINYSGYGLTLGIHSRIKHTIDTIQQHAKVGNIYINRNIIGAVVGVQPFGGMGLSGTGPKAGGPNYLQGFSVEQTVTNNTAAMGGNVSLLSKNLL